MVYATEIIVKKITRYTEEYRDKEYDKEDVVIYHYEYEELYKENDCDCITLYFKSSDIHLILKTTSFGSLEGHIKCHYPQILNDKEADFFISYKKFCIDTIICEFNGYTGRHLEQDRISLKEQIESIKKDNLLKPFWAYSPKNVPILEKFKDEIYNFLSKQ